MSNTHCRFCRRTVKGIYLNCPACGKWLPPQDVAPGRDIAPEPYELVSDDTMVITAAFERPNTDTKGGQNAPVDAPKKGRNPMTTKTNWIIDEDAGLEGIFGLEPETEPEGGWDIWTA
jgi:hypothetical protein